MPDGLCNPTSMVWVCYSPRLPQHREAPWSVSFSSILTFFEVCISSTVFPQGRGILWRCFYHQYNAFGHYPKFVTIGKRALTIMLVSIVIPNCLHGVPSWRSLTTIILFKDSKKATYSNLIKLRDHLLLITIAHSSLLTWPWMLWFTCQYNMCLHIFMLQCLFLIKTCVFNYRDVNKHAAPASDWIVPGHSFTYEGPKHKYVSACVLWHCHH